MIEAVELQPSSNSGEVSNNSADVGMYMWYQIEQVDKDDEGMDDSTMAVTDAVVSRRSLTPIKRPHVVELSLPETQNNSTNNGGVTSDVISDALSEPVTKRRKNINSKELEAEIEKGLRQTWCDKRFVVSKLDGHNDVICSLDCNQDLLLTGRLVTV